MPRVSRTLGSNPGIAKLAEVGGGCWCGGVIYLCSPWHPLPSWAQTFALFGKKSSDAATQVQQRWATLKQ